MSWFVSIILSEGLVFVAWHAFTRGRELAVERVRVDDLLSRLAARTHGEYAAFATPPPIDNDTEWLFDTTGLMGVEVDLDERA